MMFQRAKLIAIYLCLNNVHNRNEIGGFVGCQGYICVHWVFRRTVIWVIDVTSSKSTMRSYPT